MKHLWEVGHPYYCSDTNYLAPPARNNGHHVRHESWQDFLDAMGGLDPDMNLVFRWDWQKPDPADYDPEEEEAPDHDELSLYYMLQRKGDFWAHTVAVTEADEPAVRAWLTERARTITALWAPLDLGAAEEKRPAAPA